MRPHASGARLPLSLGFQGRLLHFVGLKKRPVPIFRPVPPVKLYLDDIERIVEILREGTRATLEIATGEYELDNVSELLDLDKERIPDLHIHSRTATPISLDFSYESAVIQSSSSTAEIRGVIAMVEDVLAGCRRSILWRFLHQSSQNAEIRGYSTIILKRRAEDPSFLKRKKDDVILLLAGAALGVGGTIVVDLLIRHSG